MENYTKPESPCHVSQYDQDMHNVELYSPEYWKIWKSKTQNRETNLVEEENSRQIQLLQKAARKKTPLRYGSHLAYKRRSNTSKKASLDHLSLLSTKPRVRATYINKSNTKDIVGEVDHRPQYMSTALENNVSGGTFGLSTRTDWNHVLSSNTNPHASQQNHNCGPGSYNISSAIGFNSPLSNHRSSYQFGFSSMPRMELKNTSINDALYCPKMDSIKPNTTQVTFSSQERFKNSSNPLYDLPGPGQYKSSSTLKQIQKGHVKKYHAKVDFEKINTSRSIKIHYGYGCNIEEHVKYGQCLDGNCLERSNWEKHKSNTKTSNTEKSNERKTTPLHFACEFGKIDVVKHLCDQNCDFNATDDEGCTPLHLACCKGMLEIVKYIIEIPTWHAKLRINRIPFDLSKQNNEGDTCLHLATKSEHEHLVKYLLDHGANINIPNNDGNIPLQVVGKNQRIYQMLKVKSQKEDWEDKIDELHSRTNLISLQESLQVNEKKIHEMAGTIEHENKIISKLAHRKT